VYTMSFNQVEDWYSVSRKQLTDLGGVTLLHEGRSLFSLLSSVYPDVRWDSSRFKKKRERLPDGYYRNEDNLLADLNTAERKLGVQQVQHFPVFLSLCTLALSCVVSQKIGGR